MAKKKLEYLVVDQTLRGKASAMFYKGRWKFLKRGLKNAQDTFLHEIIGDCADKLVCLRESIVIAAERGDYSVIGEYFEEAVFLRDRLCALGDSDAQKTWSRKYRKYWQDAFRIYNECETLVVLLMYPESE